jgi:hypothetical protein
MSLIADNRSVINFTNQTTTSGVVLDLSTIDLLSIGATYVPVSGGTGTLAVYESVDGVNYVAVTGLTVAISASGTTIWHINPIFSHFYKILYTATSNGMNLVVTLNPRNNTDYDDVTVLPPPVVVAS